MVDTTQLLQSTGDPVEQSRVVRGYISTNRPAPAGFPVPGSEANLLWVITPETSLERPWGPCQWNADHGSTLPAQGAECDIVFDDHEIPTVVWWAAKTSFATGSGGEGVAGIYVGPTAPKPPVGSGSYLWVETNVGETEVLEIRLGKA
jgi:hypothetical protein